jgi:hypothetical protein
VLDLVTLPWSIFGPLIGNAMVKYQKLSFRINFIIGVILNLLTIITITAWYHPPPGSLAPGESKRRKLASLDWAGLFFLAAGIVLTLTGLSYGGKQAPWGSASVITPIVFGFLSLIMLGVWESKIAKNPFFAHELFRGKTRTFTIQLFLTFVGGMSLYTASAFWVSNRIVHLRLTTNKCRLNKLKWFTRKILSELVSVPSLVVLVELVSLFIIKMHR